MNSRNTSDNATTAPEILISSGTEFVAEVLLERIQYAASNAQKPNLASPRVAGLLSAMKKELASADFLNERHARLPLLLQRLLRKQGRINRHTRAAGTLAVARLRANPLDEVSTRALDAAEHHLLTAQHLQHKARGPALLRRLRRPQHELNEAVAEALTQLDVCIRSEMARREVINDAIAANLGHLRWHSREIRHVNAEPPGKLTFVKRIRCNQYLINRYEIVALRVLHELLSNF